MPAPTRLLLSTDDFPSTSAVATSTTDASGAGTSAASSQTLPPAITELFLTAARSTSAGTGLRRLFSSFVASTESSLLGASAAEGMRELDAIVRDRQQAKVTSDAITPPHLEAIRWMGVSTGLSQADLAALLGVTRQTLHLWRSGEHITTANMRRVLVTRDILERAAARVTTRAGLSGWLHTPRGASSTTPAEYLKRGDFDRARLLAASSPSSRIRPPLWIRDAIPEENRVNEERRQVPEPLEPSDDLG